MVSYQILILSMAFLAICCTDGNQLVLLRKAYLAVFFLHFVAISACFALFCFLNILSDLFVF